MKKASNFFFIGLINIVLIQVLLELGLYFIMFNCWPCYFLPHNYPNKLINTNAGKIQAEWVSNSQGFHDVEHSFRKPANTIRIVTIGDSFLDGPMKLPLSGKLKELLTNSAITEKQIEVINLSRPGIDTDLYYFLFQHVIDNYNPDIILNFFYSGNDFRNMEKKTIESLNKGYKFFERYPKSSLYSYFFPRSSILISDFQKNKFVHKWTDTSKRYRWGKPYSRRDLNKITNEIAKYIKLKPKEIKLHLEESLSESELNYLTKYPVRLDLLAYFIGIGKKVAFTPRLGIKEHRPEIKSAEVFEQQVNSVYNFLQTMSLQAKVKDIIFYVVHIPTSNIDPIANNVYTRLGAGNDPLFMQTRRPQTRALSKLLIENKINYINLENYLNKDSTYLVFDTHWTNKGVTETAQTVKKYLTPHLKELSIE